MLFSIKIHQTNDGCEIQLPEVLQQHEISCCLYLRANLLHGQLLTHDLLHLHNKSRFLPQREHLALSHPVLRRRIELQVERPDNLREYQTHFRVSQILSKAVPRAETERLQRAALVVCVFGVTQPALGRELLWVLEVAR